MYNILLLISYTFTKKTHIAEVTNSNYLRGRVTRFSSLCSHIYRVYILL